AYAAQCRGMRPSLGYSPDAERDFHEADAFLRRALENDPADPIALSIAAFIAVVSRRDYQTGGDLIDRSLSINPNDARAWGIRGWISVWAGDTETAMT